MAIKYFILLLQPFFSISLNKCNNTADTNKVTIIGIAVEIKNQAAVKTDDSLLYYLDGIARWDEKHMGKRVKVKGKLQEMKAFPSAKNSNPNVTGHPQPRLRRERVIRNPKWKLVK